MKQKVFDLAVTGDLLLPSGILKKGTLYVEAERIAALSQGPDRLPVKEHIDASNKFVFPGAICVDSRFGSLNR